MNQSSDNIIFVVRAISNYSHQFLKYNTLFGTIVIMLYNTALEPILPI